MTIERMVRLISGFLILLSIVLAYKHSPFWLALNVYVGLSLLQSGFSNWSPVMTILKKMGFKQSK
jgi:hypothetical protein